MLKKNEVMTVLENGGYILISEIYRTATVYDLAGERLDVCRYDTAENIEKMTGYGAEKKFDPWSYTRQVCNIIARRDLLAEAARQLDEITTPGTIRIKARTAHHIDGVYIPAGRTFLITVYGNGAHGSPGNAYGKIYGFRSEKHAHMYSIIDFKPAQ